MIDWEILDDRPMPDGGENEEPEPRAPTRWVVLLLVLLLLGGGILFWRLIERKEARLEEDIEQAVILEERALRFGAVEQIDDLVDPDAPSEWRFRYETLFYDPPEEAAIPEVKSIDYQGDTALVSLGYQDEENEWQVLRGYRMTSGEWRRSPVSDRWWSPSSTYHSHHFTLRISERDSELLPPETLLNFLENFYERFISQWSSSNPGHITLHIKPVDLGPPVLGTPDRAKRQITMNSPLLSAHLLPFLPHSQAYKLVMANSVASLLDNQPPATDPEAFFLRMTLREALVRDLVLEEKAQSAYRQSAETSSKGSISEWEMQEHVNPVLLADYLIALEGQQAPARLLNAYKRSTNLEAATVQAFGYPLEGLIADIKLWKQTSGRSPLAGSPVEREAATVVRLTSARPFEALVVREDGSLASLRTKNEFTFPLSLRCLGSGSRLSFQAEAIDGSQQTVEGRDVRIESLALPGQSLTSFPEESRLLLIRRTTEWTRILALDKQGQEKQILSVPGAVELVTHPFRLAFAFIQQDECGTSVNWYEASSNRILRSPVPLRGKGHLFWDVQGELYLLDDLSQSEKPRWLLRRITGGQTEVEIPVDRSMRWEELQGYSPTSDRYLIKMEDGKRYWIDFQRWHNGIAAVPVVASIDLPTEAEEIVTGPLSPAMAYSISGSNSAESAGIHIYDISREKNFPIRGSDAGNHITRLKGNNLFIVNKEQGSESNLSTEILFVNLQVLRFGFVGKLNEVLNQVVRQESVEGIIEELIPCQGEGAQLLYQLRDRPATLNVMNVYGEHYHSIATSNSAGQVVECIILDSRE